MKISNKYVVVERVGDEKGEGFQTVEIQDNFLYKGKIVQLPITPVYMGNDHVMVGDVIVFAKYSPDTHETDINGKKVKFVSVDDILCVL